MWVSEVISDVLVIAFLGLSHGVEGNTALMKLAKEYNAPVFAHTEGARAEQLIQQHKGRTVLIGYSAGAGTVLELAAKYPITLSIVIAGYPTTLQRGEESVKGRLINYYDPRELNAILQSKGLGVYKPRAGQARTVQASHGSIVAKVSDSIRAEIDRL